MKRALASYRGWTIDFYEFGGLVATNPEFDEPVHADDLSEISPAIDRAETVARKAFA